MSASPTLALDLGFKTGWSPADDHQADALALLDYVITNAERPAA